MPGGRAELICHLPCFGDGVCVKLPEKIEGSF
jgi:hypothetical protein